ncbi:MAG: MerR family transcriptional regulator [Pirellulaceae bacterium]
MPAESLLTIDQLAAKVAEALSGEILPGQNGRVREVPDVRTLRYYTTIGLLDRPAEMRGRTALYGRRHLRQLVAVKRLQAKGLSLTEVQARLINASGRELARLAQLPKDFEFAPAPLPPEPERKSSREPTSSAAPPASPLPFWKQPPAPLERNQPQETKPATEEISGSMPLHAIPLAEGAALLLGARRPPDDDDLEAIRVAAQPLLKLLARRRLL